MEIYAIGAGCSEILLKVGVLLDYTVSTQSGEKYVSRHVFIAYLYNRSCVSSYIAENLQGYLTL